GCFLEDELQIRRLAAQPGAVVDNLAVDLTRCEVDETQKVSSETPAKRLSRTTPSTRQPLATNSPDYSIGSCWFLYHNGRPWRRLPMLPRQLPVASCRLPVDICRIEGQCSHPKMVWVVGTGNGQPATAYRAVGRG